MKVKMQGFLELFLRINIKSLVFHPKILIFSISILSSGMFSNAQNLNLEWAKSIGGSALDEGKSVITDKSGNVYTTGYFSDKTDFDPGKDTFYLTSNGGYDIFVSKLDANGKLVWAFNIGGNDNDAGNSINKDDSGNIYVTGYFADKVDFNPDTTAFYLTSAGEADIFVFKFNPTGKLKWAVRMGGAGYDVGNGIDLDNKRNIYSTGYFNDSADFNPSSSSTSVLGSFGATDIYISSLDNNGNYIWVGQMGGTDNDEGAAIACDSIGYVFTTGYFSNQADLDPTSKGTYNVTSVGDADIFVCKVAINGTFSWTYSAGDKAFDAGTGIAVDAVGNNYTTGLYYGAPDFDPGTGKGQVYKLTANGDYDIFVWKLDASGGFSYAKSMGGADFDMGLSIAIDNSNNAYTTGLFTDVADFDPSSSTYNLSSYGSYDIFISKLNASGNYVWALNIGDADEDIGTSITVDKAKAVYLTGFYYSTVDFDPRSGTYNLTSNGDADAFVVKLSICKASATAISASGCNSYNFNGTTYYKSGEYYKILKNSIGCDSVITLTLKIHEVSIGNLNIIACKSYTLNGQTYTTSGTYDQTLKNKNGCDSFLVLTLTLAENKGALTAKACNSYSVNGQTYTKSGTSIQTLKNHLGCDSVLTLKLTILKSSSATVNITACNNYTLQTKTYTTSGTYIQTINNHMDCDSVITINLTLNNSSSHTINTEACGNYTLNAQTYNTSGTYKQTIANTKGCDSVITLNLKLNNTEGVHTIRACNSFTLAGKSYTESGIYTQIIPNAKGCDSLLTLNITINKVINTVTQSAGTLTSDQIDATYQWLDCNKSNSPISGAINQSYTPTATGDYAVKVTKDNCIVNSACVNVKVGKINKQDIGNIMIFPNPTQGESYVLLTNGIHNGSLKLMNVTGQTMIYLPSQNGNKFVINLAKEPNGIYFIEINENGKVWRGKLIKN